MDLSKTDFLRLFVLLLGLHGTLRAEPNDCVLYEENRVDTLHYRVPQRAFFASASISTPLHYAETIGVNGSTVNTYDTTLLNSSLNVSYGVFDDFLISVTEGYLFKKNVTTTALPAGTATTTEASGFSDPTFSANYRYLGGLKGNYFGNGFLIVSPKSGTAKNSDSGQAGNNLNGSSSVNGGVNFYLVRDVHEFVIEASGTYRTTGSYTSSDPTNSSTSDAYFTWGFTGGYRYHFLDNFYASGSVTLTLAQTINYTFGNQVPVLTEQVSDPVNFSPTLEVGWRAFSGASFYVRYSRYGYARTITPSAGSTLNSIYSQTLISIGAGIQL